MERRIKFGQKLKSLREKKKLTQTEASKALEISQNIISQYESGTRIPSFENLIKMADYFGISLDEMVFDAQPAADSYMEENKDFLADIEKNISPRELLGKYNLVIDGEPATEEEIKEAINLIKFNRSPKDSI